MSAIPSGVILIWTGTNASIPAGWERVTDLDGKYPKAWGASVAPNVTGGADTHTHAGGHTHTLTSHTHAFVLDTYTSGNTYGLAGSSSSEGSGAHSHASNTSQGSSGGSLQSNGSWASVNQEPPYHTVIFIKPISAVAPILSGICSYFNGSLVPGGWFYCDGNNGTPNLVNKYIKGASANADAGGTGGTVNHQHTVTHNHTANTHNHYGLSGGMAGNYVVLNAGSIYSLTPKAHIHEITFANSTDTINNYTKTDAGVGDTVEPAYKKLGIIKSNGGGAKKGIVGLWLGSVASIPINWAICDGNNGTLDLRDKFIKIGAALANNNETGGSNTHSHTAVSHTHTPTGTHNHADSVSLGANIGVNKVDGHNNAPTIDSGHTHTATVTPGTSAYSTDNMTADTVNNEPAYRTVAYIQLIKLNLGGAFLMSKLI